MRVVENDLDKVKLKLSKATEKCLKANSERDTTISDKKAALDSLKEKSDYLTKIEKELVEVQKELADARKEVGSTSRHDERRDDSMERLQEKERIKLDSFEQKAVIARKNKEKEERRKTDAKTSSYYSKTNYIMIYFLCPWNVKTPLFL